MRANHWVPIREVAARCRIARPTALKQLQAGTIPGLTKHFGTTRVDRAIFEQWLKKTTILQK